jgi:hypothetical protein
MLKSLEDSLGIGLYYLINKYGTKFLMVEHSSLRVTNCTNRFLDFSKILEALSSQPSGSRHSALRNNQSFGQSSPYFSIVIPILRRK